MLQGTTLARLIAVTSKPKTARCLLDEVTGGGKCTI